MRTVYENHEKERNVEDIFMSMQLVLIAKLNPLMMGNVFCDAFFMQCYSFMTSV